MSDADDLQIMLQAALERQAACYESALLTTAELAGVHGRGESLSDHLQQIIARLNEIAEHEQHLASLKERWHQAGRPAEASLRAVIERVVALIRRLSRELNDIEEIVRRRRDELADELDGCNRRRQMQRAYLRKS